MDKPYLYSLLALRVRRTGIEMVHRAGQVQAPSQDRAAALALQVCHVVFPELEGFGHHSVALCPARAAAGGIVCVMALDD